MASDVRQRMVRSAVRLLAQRGLQATSFAEVLQLAEAPRGSVYHHFPDGKDELVGEALDLAGGHAIALIDQWEGATPAEVTASFLAAWRHVLVESDFGAGCAVLAVTVATDSPAQLDHVATIFRSWRVRLAALLAAGGLAPATADAFAATLVAASEGAVVLSRAEQSLEPFDLVADQMSALVAQLAA